jgi:hypothetical protein
MLSRKPCLLFPSSFLALYKNLSFPDAQFLSHNRRPHGLSAVRSRSRQRNLGLEVSKAAGYIVFLPKANIEKNGWLHQVVIMVFQERRGEKMFGCRKKVLGICTGL